MSYIPLYSKPITHMSKVNTECNDLDGNVLREHDRVVILDIEDLDEGCNLVRGRVLIVRECKDPESNSILFTDYLFQKEDYEIFGHRVLKLRF